MNPALLAALLQFTAQVGVPLVGYFFHKDPSTGVPTLTSVNVILDEASGRNAETIQLIAAANAQPKV